mmetsp:Transcript_9120/g.17766  ORF Transcript_9120/g.17766 Transcript_9120/m.17766 type:complete len:217 (-) Transcript_9120:430-1080(-)
MDIETIFTLEGAAMILGYTFMVVFSIVLVMVLTTRLLSRLGMFFIEQLKSAIKLALIEVMTPVLVESLIQTFQHPRMADALVVTMSRIMKRGEMRRATKEFATTFAREAAESKPLKREAVKLTNSLAAEFIEILRVSAMDTADIIPLFGPVISKCVCGGRAKPQFEGKQLLIEEREDILHSDEKSSSRKAAGPRVRSRMMAQQRHERVRRARQPSS